MGTTDRKGAAARTNEGLTKNPDGSPIVNAKALRWNSFRTAATHPSPNPLPSKPQILVTPDQPAVPGPAKVRALTNEELNAVIPTDDVNRPGRPKAGKRLKPHKQRRSTLYLAVSEEEEQLIRAYCQVQGVPLSRFLRAAAFAAMGQVMPRRR